MPINFPVILELQKNNRTNFALKEFRAAVEQVYQKFATYKLKDDLRRCLHCVTEQDNDRLHGRRLVELQPAELEKYGRKALTTWGDVDDFRHFLPRLLEFYPFIGTGLLPPEIVFGKLRYANWRNWPNEEQSALEDYFFALWRYAVVAIEPTPWTYCDDFLCAIAQADNDLLHTWSIGKSANQMLATGISASSLLKIVTPWGLGQLGNRHSGTREADCGIK